MDNGRAGTPAGGETARVVGMGEALIRLSTAGRARIEQVDHLRIDVGGAELNTLVALARLGHPARFVTRLPDNPLGMRIAEHAHRHGVEPAVLWQPGGRAGLYFVEPGAQPRPTEVLYDRADSAAAGIAAGMFDWSTALADAGALHISGITCALGAGPHSAVIEAFAAARERGVLTSFDVNHRARLWSREHAASALWQVLPRCDVVFASALDLSLLLGRDGAAPELARRLREQAGVATVVVRQSAGDDAGTVEVTVTVVGEDEVAGEPARAQVVDPLGAGDVSAAAFLSATMAGEPYRAAAGLAARACAHMHTVAGDTWIVRPGELNADYGRGARVLR